jgi:teichuronic acid biosynthesis glycosyltransferase TuaC
MNNNPNILVLTTLYPNSIQFRHGIFVETRVKQLNKTGKFNIKIIAPIPWFPFKLKYFPSYSKLVDIPKYEIREGIQVYHPRYVVIPKCGMWLTPFFLGFCIISQIKKLRKQEGYSFDFIDAHYYYPDGVAAALVASWLNKPLAITARGTDINLIPNFTLPRKMILWASKVAKFNFAVSSALRNKMHEIGIDESTLHVLRNGVDLNQFAPLNRDFLRKKWQINGKLLISVGNLIELKGHHLVIDALEFLPDYQLCIVGGGECEDELKIKVKNSNVHDRVRFLGELLQQQLIELYNCADALVLASSREGWPNVLLEALACGTPVIATKVGACPEMIQSPEAGVLCLERTPNGIAVAINRLFSNYPDRKKTRLYAECFSWNDTTENLIRMFSDISITNFPIISSTANKL